MTGDEIDQAEADAEHLLQLAGLFPDEPTPTREIARALGIEVVYSRNVKLARGRESDIVRVGAQWTIHLFQRMTPTREAWIVGHELGHWLFRQRSSRPRNEERMADAIGAALVAPRAAFAAAAKKIGHRVHLLADAFETTQALALLRLGEVTGRPVLLFRSPEPLVRGDESFEWTCEPRSLPRAVAHLVRVDAGWGMMGERYGVAA